MMKSTIHYYALRLSVEQNITYTLALFHVETYFHKALCLGYPFSEIEQLWRNSIDINLLKPYERTLNDV